MNESKAIHTKNEFGPYVFVENKNLQLTLPRTHHSRRAKIAKELSEEGYQDFMIAVSSYKFNRNNN